MRRRKLIRYLMPEIDAADIDRICTVLMGEGEWANYLRRLEDIAERDLVKSCRLIPRPEVQSDE